MIEFELSEVAIDFSLKLEGEYAIVLALIVGFLAGMFIKFLLKKKEKKEKKEEVK